MKEIPGFHSQVFWVLRQVAEVLIRKVWRFVGIRVPFFFWWWTHMFTLCIYIYTNLEGHSHKLRKIIPNCPNFPLFRNKFIPPPCFCLCAQALFFVVVVPPCSSQQQKIGWFFGGCICESLEKKRESVFAAWLRTSPWSPVAWLQKKTQEVQLPEAIGGVGGVYFFSITWKKGGVLGGVFLRFFGGWILGDWNGLKIQIDCRWVYYTICDMWYTWHTYIHIIF